MSAKPPRKADLRRWNKEVLDHIEGFPRLHRGLTNSMSAFGGDFDLKLFKDAFNTEVDMDAFNQAQAVERALGRVQNYVAEMAINGSKLAGLPAAGASGSEAVRAFTSLRDAGVIRARLCRDLSNAQKDRARIEHSYPDLAAGDVHRAAKAIARHSVEFYAVFVPWIKPYT